MGRRGAPAKPETQLNYFFYQYVVQAKNRGFVFSIMKEDCLVLFRQACYYCGKIPAVRKLKRSHVVGSAFNGLDRVDNSRGYVLDNVVPCCIQCNRAKRSDPVQDFISMCHRVAELHPTREACCAQKSN